MRATHETWWKLMDFFGPCGVTLSRLIKRMDNGRQQGIPIPLCHGTGSCRRSATIASTQNEQLQTAVFLSQTFLLSLLQQAHGRNSVELLLAVLGREPQSILSAVCQLT